MSATTLVTPMSGVERRLERLRLRPVTAVAIVAALVVLVGDSQSLTLIPLLGTMVPEYHLTAGEAALVLSIIGLVSTGFAPVITRLAERVSLRWFLVVGLFLSTVGNLLCAVAPDFTLLIIGRVLLGITASGPISIALMREMAKDGKGTTRGMGLVTAAVGLGIAISFLLGGTILALNGDVHTVFWIMTALAGISFLAAVAIAPDYRVKHLDRADIPGALLLVIALTGIAVAISFSGSWGWGSPLTLTLLIGGVLVGAVWVLVELNVPHPMLDLRRTFRRSTVPAYIMIGVLSALALLSNLVVEGYVEWKPIAAIPALDYGFGGTVLTAALFLMPTAFFVLFGGFIISPIVNRLGIKGTLILSGVLVPLGFAFGALFHTQVWENLLTMAIWGFAFAMGYTAANAAVLHAARDGEGTQFSAASTVAAGVVSSPLGAPLFTAVVAATVVPLALPTGEKLFVPSAASYTAGWWACAILGAIALICALLHRTVPFQGGPVEAQAVEVPDAVTGMPDKVVLPD